MALAKVILLLAPVLAQAAGNTLVYSTYLGGAGDDTGAAILVDKAGNAILAGNTFVIGSTYQQGFVAKLDPTGSNIIFKTPLTAATDLCVTGATQDASGNIIVIGYTDPGACDATANATGFVTKLGPTGSQVFSVTVGGAPLAVAADQQGNIYLTGFALTGLATTTGVVQAANQGSYDAFVVKLSSDGAKVLYATYLGGSNADIGRAIAVDATGQVYIAGDTASADFPLKNAAQPKFGGLIPVLYSPSYGDAFVAKLDPNGANLVYSTYWGGTEADIAFGIAIDSSGNAYVAGATQSADFPVSAGAYQQKYGGGTVGEPDPYGDAFVARFSPQGASLWSTYLGGNGRDWAAGVALDASGNVYLVGTTESPDFPYGANALPSCRRTGGPFVSELDAAGAHLLASTPLAGMGYDYGIAMALDSTGVYVAGDASSLVFLASPSAVQKSFGGGDTDAFVAKVNLAASPGLYPACVLNGASFLPGNEANFFHGTVAPGEIASVFGLGLGPSPAVQYPQLTAAGSVAATLGGTEVLFDGIPAPMLYSGVNQINLVVPYGINANTTQMTIQSGGVTYGPVLMPVAAAVPAIFTLDGSGQGQAVVLNQDGTFNSVSNPAPRGTVITFYAEGTGVFSPPMADGSVAPLTLPLPAPALPVTVSIRGATVTPLFAGAAPGYVSGLLQVNAQVPTTIDFGNSVPLSLNVGTFSSQYNITIAVQ